jgi:PncC family amidohydrolase
MSQEGNTMMRPQIAVAESITGGKLADLFVSVPGASACFKGALSPYDLDGKVRILEVDREHAASVNCVSPTVARQMAEGVARQLRADVGVATTGFAESVDDIKPHAFICAYNSGTKRFKELYVGCEVWEDRNQFRTVVANRAKSLCEELLKE